MKKAAIIGILCIAFGFGAGWLARQGSIPKKSPANAASKSERADRPGSTPSTPEDPQPTAATKGEDRTGDTGQGDKPSAEIRQAAREQQARLQKDILARRAGLDRDRLARLTAALDLAPEQKAKLQAFLKANREKLAALLAPERAGDWVAARDTAALLRNEGLDKLLDGILDDRQRDSYQEFKAAEHLSELDKRAQRTLREIEESVELATGQRDPVLNLLRSEAGRQLADAPDASALIALWEEAIGVEVDPNGFGVAQAFQSQLEKARDASGNPADPTSWMSGVKDRIDVRIQQKVHQMGNVLDASQLASYRRHLESQAKTLGILQHIPEPDAGLVGPK